MKTPLRTILSAAVICLYGFPSAGCNNNASRSASSPPTSEQESHEDHDHEGHDHDDHDGHDHDDHEGHDHPAHGPNGGHMINLSGGAHAEWAHDDESDLITVYAEKPESVTKVEMKTNIGGTETVYEFEKKEADGKTMYEIVSPELLTAVKMGTGVDTTLVITTEDGQATAKVEHHSH
jgi:ABC-type Zn2+ transport system substrate-binding protein/surface adhesin